ncbi:MAG: sensor histidine kinase N-terminal domain-containing protein [Rhodospirillales bacterium]|nr:sensor histidine kinase N-terminal domain-containing protein [Alphaproteobacteria bacterium]MCB9981476.1 sensor histidine kinase N-terminal domain-containing protein [Rhodospirillales bacterium]
MGAYDEIEEVSDAQLAHSAKVLLQLIEHKVGEHAFYEIELGVERPELAHKYENKVTFRIWKEEHLVTESHQAKSFGAFRAPPGFSDHIIAGEEWRFFVFIDSKTNVTVEVAEKSEVRRELIFKILLGLFVPLSLFIPLLLVIVWYGVTRCLKPVITLSQSVDQRDSNDFTAIETNSIPQEIQPLIRALNRLLKRINSSFERERQFTDNAAHELRTPLAAMKTQTQVLLKKAAVMPDCKDGLDNLHDSIDRASRMVDQLLSFARLQADHIELKTVDISVLVQEVLKEISPLAVHKKQDVEAKISSEIRVHGNAHALYIMIRNLIENAIKFTSEKGQIVVSVERKGDEAILHVVDTGPGIKSNEKEKVFERFYRAEKNGPQGSGLGMAMVKWICDVHNAEITLEDNDPNGLIATVTMKVI